MSRRLAALVLAAGASSRLGQPKQLVRFRGEALVERAVRVAREAGASPVFVVLGCAQEEIIPLLQANEFEPRILINKAWQRGMSTSIALGAAAAERVDAEDLLVLTCDQVAVTTEHLHLLMNASRREHVVASHYSERRGIPALFPNFSFHALQELTGDAGARELLQDDAVLTVPLLGGEFDVDTPEDLDQLRRMEGEGQRAASATTA